MRHITLAILVVLIAMPAPAQARIQRDIVCWVPDCEFPIDCDEDED